MSLPPPRNEAPAPQEPAPPGPLLMLLQGPRHWQPFARSGARRRFYQGDAPASAVVAAAA